MSSIFYINFTKKNGISYAISIIHLLILLIAWVLFYIYDYQATNEEIILSSIIRLITIIWTIYVGLVTIYIFITNKYISTSDQRLLPQLGETYIADATSSINGKWIKHYIIGQYTFDGTIYYWYDWLRVFRITQQNDAFQLAGDALPQNNTTPSKPFYLDQEQQHSGQAKKVQDELFAFKHFETGDDPRRIVWKIYGKNRTLHVRKADDNYVASPSIYITLHQPKNNLNIAPAIYAILESEYKRNVLHTLQEWRKDATIYIELDGNQYPYSQQFEQAWLQQQHDSSVASSEKQNGIVFINNFSQHDIVANQNCILFDYSLHQKNKQYNRLFFRASKESIQLRKQIKASNNILAHQSHILHSHCINIISNTISL